jgi:hypothetical protein
VKEGEKEEKSWGWARGVRVDSKSVCAGRVYRKREREREREGKPEAAAEREEKFVRACV